MLHAILPMLLLLSPAGRAGQVPAGGGGSEAGGASAGEQAPAKSARLPPLRPFPELGRNRLDAALVVVNGDYEELPDLPAAEEDGELVREFFSRVLGLPRYRLRVLRDATVRQVERELRRVRGRVRKGGTLWIYYQGHASSVDGVPALLPVDARLQDLSPVLGLDSVHELLQRSRAERVVLVLDTSFSALARDGASLSSSPLPSFSKLAFPDDPRFACWVGARSGAPGDWQGHGLFTWLALGALEGWADGALDGQRDGTVTLGEAEFYVYRQLRRLERLQVPSIDPRDEGRAWVLLSGELAPAPGDELFERAARADRRRRMAAREEALRRAVAAAWEDARQRAEQGERGALESFVSTYEAPVLTFRWSPYLPEVDEARLWLLDWEARSAALAESGGKGEAEDTGAGDTGGPASCDDLQALEEPALAGALTQAQIDCLEQRIQDAEKQTTKDKISRVLLVDAEKKGDRQRWEQLVKRHLAEIDQSDPDFCFKYAVFLSRQGVERAEEAIRWANRALENKDHWKGEDYERRVYALDRLRAEAAAELWSDAEERYLQERTPQAEAASEHYRAMAKEYAKEWLDYARLSGQPDQAALELCLSAAGTMAFCHGKGP